MNDDELRSRFAELREEERAIVPPLRVAKPQRAAWRLAACVVLILIVVALARRGHDEFTIEDRIAAQRISAWRAPTDSLLATPGRELLATTPDIPGALPKGVAP